MTQDQLEQLRMDYEDAKSEASQREFIYLGACREFHAENCPFKTGDKVKFLDHKTEMFGIFLGLKGNFGRPVIAKLKKDGTQSANNYPDWSGCDSYTKLTKVH
jgi:hypothetical protein